MESVAFDIVASGVREVGQDGLVSRRCGRVWFGHGHVRRIDWRRLSDE